MPQAKKAMWQMAYRVIPTGTPSIQSVTIAISRCINAVASALTINGLAVGFQKKSVNFCRAVVA
jgi:hypothetical protein